MQVRGGDADPRVNQPARIRFRRILRWRQAAFGPARGHRLARDPSR